VDFRRKQSNQELAEQVAYYLEHIDEADPIREQDKKRVALQWTYSNWIDMILEKIGMVGPGGGITTKYGGLKASA
jgi:spore maturation protein CgeB